MFKKFIAVGMAVLLAVCTVMLPQEAEAKEFKDVGPNFWAYDTIMWGIQQGVIKGYPDGTFKPNNHVTEAQFVAMLIRAYENRDESTAAGEHWAEPFYKYAKQLNWPTLGASKLDLRDKPITRGKVAEILTAANGYNFTGDTAIQYVLNVGLAKGRTSDTVEGYDGKSNLTRAQAVQFIRNAKDSGVIIRLKDRPVEPTPLDQMPQKGQVKGSGDVRKDILAMSLDDFRKAYGDYIVITRSGDKFFVGNYTEGAWNLAQRFGVGVWLPENFSEYWERRTRNLLYNSIGNAISGDYPTAEIISINNMAMKDHPLYKSFYLDPIFPSAPKQEGKTLIDILENNPVYVVYRKGDIQAYYFDVKPYRKDGKFYVQKDVFNYFNVTVPDDVSKEVIDGHEMVAIEDVVKKTGLYKRFLNLPKDHPFEGTSLPYVLVAAKMEIADYDIGPDVEAWPEEPEDFDLDELYGDY